jgi:hypothetical protein
MGWPPTVLLFVVIEEMDIQRRNDFLPRRRDDYRYLGRRSDKDGVGYAVRTF